jgi:hypothetical protein
MKKDIRIRSCSKYGFDAGSVNWGWAIQKWNVRDREYLDVGWAPTRKLVEEYRKTYLKQK